MYIEVSDNRKVICSRVLLEVFSRSIWGGFILLMAVVILGRSLVFSLFELS